MVKDGCTFEINSNFNESMGYNVDDELNLGNMELESSVDGNKYEHFDYSDLFSPWTKSFEELKLKMEQINPYIWKSITKQGRSDVPQVPQNARVIIRYNAFWEGEKAPFDSSVLRGRDFKFETGRCNVLEGLEAAVCTMHPEEQAQFIISYHLLFHEMGCPPRVKPKADGLFIIELLSYDLVGNLNAELDVPQEDRHKFALIKNKLHEIHVRGKDFFKRKCFREAIQAFEKVSELLKFSILANEEEAEEQSNFLIKVITNLAVCYNKVNMPRRACSMCKEIRQLTDKPPCKALFHGGKASLMLGDYDNARLLLIEAQKMEPSNEAINAELKILAERMEKYQNSRYELCRNALGLAKESDDLGDADKSTADLSPMETQIQKVLLDFVADSKRTKLTLPPGLTKKEIDTVKSMAQKMNLVFIADFVDKSKYTVIKH